jgi:hypothetical protein
MADLRPLVGLAIAAWIAHAVWSSAKHGEMALRGYTLRRRERPAWFRAALLVQWAIVALIVLGSLSMWTGWPR